MQESQGLRGNFAHASCPSILYLMNAAGAFPQLRFAVRLHPVLGDRFLSSTKRHLPCTDGVVQEVFQAILVVSVEGSPIVNANDQEWLVHEHGGYRKPYSLDEAWAVLIAEDAHGESLGWMYVVDAGDHLTPQLLYVDPQHRRRRVARALVEHLHANYQGETLLGAWDRDLYEVWIKLGFVYEPPAEGERPGDLRGNMVRPRTQPPPVR
jgi:GNAT superfamily N-acetyltransferase